MSKLEYRLSNVAYNSNENPLVDERTLVVIVNPECVLPDDYLFALWTEHLVAFFDTYVNSYCASRTEFRNVVSRIAGTPQQCQKHRKLLLFDKMIKI